MRILVVLTVLGLCSCSALHQTGSVDCSPAPSVSAGEAFRIAEAYRTLAWKPSQKNAFHAEDSDGILVHTPDVSLPMGVAGRPGWWQPSKVNMGMPYQWGGFDTPEEFHRKLSEGYSAGDVYTEQKRELLNAGVSRFCCGVDCSGFISRCWRLDRSYSTRELPELCVPLSSFDDLKPGDIVNKTNVHVLLFVRFLDTSRQAFLAYETGSPPSWKVLLHPISVDYVSGLGYLPFRYKNLRD